MKALIFVTGNKGKILSAIDQFNDNGLELEWYNYDCQEPEVNNIEYISKHKVLEAYNILQKPCFVVDSGFYIDHYPNEPGFPGAFPKRAVVNNGLESLLDNMKDVATRSCQFIDCLTYYDGTEFKVFYGVSKGNLSYEPRGIEQVKAKSVLWYVFVPINHDKTLAEMNDEERNNRNDGRTSAVGQLIRWLKETKDCKIYKKMI